MKAVILAFIAIVSMMMLGCAGPFALLQPIESYREIHEPEIGMIYCLPESSHDGRIWYSYTPEELDTLKEEGGLHGYLDVVYLGDPEAPYAMIGLGTIPELQGYSLLEIGFDLGSDPNTTFVKVEKDITVAGYEAMRIDANQEGLKYTEVWFIKDGMPFRLKYGASAELFHRYEPTFEVVLDSIEFE